MAATILRGLRHTVILMATTLSVTAQTRTTCPPTIPCTCSSSDPGSALEVTCAVDVLDSRVYNLSLIPTETTRLTITCSTAQPSHLQNRTFHFLSSITELHILDCGFTALPSEIFYGLNSLESLTLEGVGNPGLGGILSPLIKLRNVSIAQNTFVQLPNDLWCGINTLRNLNISRNLFKNLHDAALSSVDTNGCLHQLQVLDASRNSLGHVERPMLLGLTSLQYLDLSGNEITGVHDNAFLGMNKLEILNFRNNNLSEINNDTFEGLSEIASLDLSGNQITTIDDDALGSIQAVIHINLSDNALHTFPMAIVSAVDLQSLDISYNAISQLPSRNMMPTMSNLVQIGLRINDISYLPRLAFSWAPNLKILDLSYNTINFIEYAGFQGLPHLEVLQLEYNQVDDLTMRLTSLTSLRHLYMAYNQVTSISQEVLPASLQYIDFYFNHVTEIVMEAFIHMDNLRRVNLAYNQIRQLSNRAILVSPRAYYQPTLLLIGNPLECSCKLSWITITLFPPNGRNDYPILEDYESIRCAPSDTIVGTPTLGEVNPDDFLCTYEYNCLVLCDCCFQEPCWCGYPCPDGCACYYTNDRNTNIINCTDRNLTSVPDKLHMLATMMRLDGNNISEIEDSVFLSNNNTHVLYLNNSNIASIRPGAFRSMHSLRTLYLQENNIACLLTGTFDGLTHVQTLSLRYNVIQYIANDTFTPLISLKTLLLDENKLMVMPNDFAAMIVKLVSLTLANNPWLCECDDGPVLKSWVETNAGKVPDAQILYCYTLEPPIDSNMSSLVNHSMPGLVIIDTANGMAPYGARPLAVPMMTNEVTPASPNPAPDFEMVPVTLFNNQTIVFCDDPLPVVYPLGRLLNQDFSHCEDNSSTVVIHWDDANNTLLITVLISLGILLLVVITASLLIYNGRELIKVWLFKRYGLRFRTPKEEDEKIYDAFISYSHEDEQFVMDYLSPKLEEESPYYKLVLHYRDWIVGANIAESILESVDNSKRTILVLSNSYVKSEWCHYEFKMAHCNAIEDRKNRIIVILIDDTLPKNMGTDLKLYTKMTTYLRSDDAWFWEKLRYAMPDKKSKNVNQVENADKPEQHTMVQLM